jgi:hypothetical protein
VRFLVRAGPTWDGTSGGSFDGPGIVCTRGAWGIESPLFFRVRVRVPGRLSGPLEPGTVGQRRLSAWAS